MTTSAQPACLALRLHQGKHVTLLTRSFHVAHNRAVGLRGSLDRHQTNANLRHIAPGSRTTQHLNDDTNLGLIHLLGDHLLLSRLFILLGCCCCYLRHGYEALCNRLFLICCNATVIIIK
uniref:Uncharacterized protein n=1 Tax=Trypanosoma congolense (strain IL3000) TaxID=1068625 RepID=G0UP93_TRYCI|nr:hypothetical protein, unlikely [Trypanosoma congolense IL3000]